MFEAVEIGQKISKDDFDREEPELHTRLLEVQRALRETNIPVIIIISGVEGAGKGEIVNRLNEWLDTRGIETNAFWDESDEELERPPFWRFWRKLPPRGSIGIMFGSWYTKPIIQYVFEKIDYAEYERKLHRIARFEKMLSDDGAHIVKFWFHLSEKEQRKRLEKDAKDKRHYPLLKKFSKKYKRFSESSEHAIRLTDQGISPWHLIEATDKRYCHISTGRTLLSSLEARLKQYEAEVKENAGAKTIQLSEPEPGLNVLDQVDLSHRLTKQQYNAKLRKLQNKLHKLTWSAKEKKCSSIWLFEGWDAAGKGGAIRRMTAAMDARLYKAISIASPTEDERAQHYLWRFWRHLPRAGYVSIYDRSWYGRVLVERVEGFASEEEWKRAYQEINDFEEQLQEFGINLGKFWIHIDKDEQLRRFQEREKIPWKKHKITDEDWRNREKWDSYKLAISDMIAHTSTEYAPWNIIPGNSKQHARIEVLRIACEQLEALLSK